MTSDNRHSRKQNQVGRLATIPCSLAVSHPLSLSDSKASFIWRGEKRFLRSFHAYTFASTSAAPVAFSRVATQWTRREQFKTERRFEAFDQLADTIEASHRFRPVA